MLELGMLDKLGCAERCPSGCQFLGIPMNCSIATRACMTYIVSSGGGPGDPMLCTYYLVPTGSDLVSR